MTNLAGRRNQASLLEKKKLAAGSTLFHWGLLCVVGGHVMGILIPEGVYASLGISEHMYHKMAIGAGLPAGIAACTGLVILTYRRLFDKRIRKTRLAIRYPYAPPAAVHDAVRRCGHVSQH